MAEPDINYLKMVIRSILNISPGNVTISQLVKDYYNLEGNSLPFKHLGFKTIFEFLGTINDVLKMPPNPNMYSVITLIVHEKTSHLRQLVVNQKSKSSRFKKRYPNERSSCNRVLKSANFHDYNRNNYRNNSTPVNDHNARGYDYVKSKSSNSKPRGTVTEKLKSDIEYQCNTSRPLSVKEFKNYLIHHPDYKKMNTSNVEDSINMLKYFIYINRGGVHLKNSPCEIFPSNNSNTNNFTKPTTLTKYNLNNIVDDDEEMAYSDLCGNNYDQMVDLNFEEHNVSENEHRIIKKSISTEHHHNTNLHSITPLHGDSCQKLSTDNSLSQLKVKNYLPIRQLVNIIKTDLNEVESKNSDTVTPQNDENILKSSTVLRTAPLLMTINVKNHERKAKSNVKIILDPKKNQKDDFKSAIVDIIASFSQPITVREVLDLFKKEHGYTFPIQQFACGTYMDFFRLYPNTFRLENQCSTNSIVSLEEQIICKKIETIRKNFTHASIFQTNAAVNLEDNKLNQSEIITELLSNKKDDQQYEEPIIDNLHNSHCEKSIDSYEMYDSEMVLDSMKVKMRLILSKYKDGILCNNFMNVYGNEYNSHFTFSEYGFNSMRDMAFKLPSVFYVKVPKDNNEIILFEASRRSEFEKKPSDPSLYYKNIPKTILYNLSMFFDKHRSGVKFNELMTLYCTEYGRAYEPLKYGFVSVANMFESLNKMVEIKNNVLYTIDPFAYMHFIKNTNPTDNYEKPATAVLPANNFLLTHSNIDICNEKFRYSDIKLITDIGIKVISAEIYNPSSFYIQLAAETNNLNSLMDAMQVFYNNNNEKYTIRPELIIPELTCTSLFEDSDQWHRAKVLKIIDQENVQLLYVDYGSVEIVPKTKIRLLASKFGSYPSQAIHCGLFEFNELNYPREISEYFVDLIELGQQRQQICQLEAQFHSPKSEFGTQKMRITLFLNNEHGKININDKCSKAISKHLKEHQESVRRMIYRAMVIKK